MSETPTLRLVQIHARPDNTPIYMFVLSGPVELCVGEQLRCGGLRWTITQVYRNSSSPELVGLEFKEDLLVFQNYVIRPNSQPMTVEEFDSATARLAVLFSTLHGFDSENYMQGLRSGMRQGHPMVEALRPYADVLIDAKQRALPPLNELQVFLTHGASVG